MNHLDHSHLSIFADSILCKGSWTVHDVHKIIPFLKHGMKQPNSKKIIIDGSAIVSMDSAGAWVLDKIINIIKQKAKIELQGFSEQHLKLMSVIKRALGTQKIASQPKKLNVLAQIGKEAYVKFKFLLVFLDFIGETFWTFVEIIKKPTRLSYKHVLAVIYDTGVTAMPIVALLLFLIGVVLAYQMGLQLQTYGLNVYIVNLTGMAVLREFGPFITAIIVAGRTSSAFTALIGSMKVNEELDALKTMGVEPTERLVIPRILGLLISLPLLSFLGDVFGIFGSMVMSNSMLNIGYMDFINRLQETIEIKTYIIGIIKAPVFALIIALVGCFHGYQVAMNADSVGRNTTKSVVQAIFLIIIADAIFSVIFSWQGI